MKRENLRAMLITGLAAGVAAGMMALSSCAKRPPDAVTGDAPGVAGPGSDGGSGIPGDPHFVGGEAKGEKNFAVLINGYTKKKLSPTPWAGYWWPYKENGIASGRMTGGGSPAGKYDAARGHRTKAQDWEARNHGAGVPNVQGWWGHCNGWSGAAALFPEPRASVNVGSITFDVADIKGLLSEAAMEVDADFFGNRVDYLNEYTLPKAWDVSPNQYFLVLTNYMGKLNMGVNIDRYTTDQVWNQPLVAYSFDYPKPSDYKGNSPQAPNVYRINLTSTIYWGNDGVPADVQTPDFDWTTDGYIFDQRTLKMEVWLDGPVVFGADGKIVSAGNVISARDGDVVVGGNWEYDDGRLVDTKNEWPNSEMQPDYMWIPHAVIPHHLGDTPEEDPYGNPYVDIDWIKAHILSGGVPDPDEDGHVDPIPSVTPSHSPTPTSTPTWSPTSTPTWTPTPFPTGTPTWTPVPQPDPTWTPVPQPTGGGGGNPFPNPFPTGGGGHGH